MSSGGDAALHAQLRSLHQQLAERDAIIAQKDAEISQLRSQIASSLGGPGGAPVPEMLVREKMAEEEARRMALDRLKKRGGSRKGKLEPSERERVEEFISRVKGGELQVTKGELAKAMRLYVCPGMERSQEFFEKLVSRRGLNKSMKHLLLPRRRKEDDDGSEHSAERGTKRTRGGGSVGTPSHASHASAYAAQFGGGRRGTRSPGPDVMGGGDMGPFMGGYSNQGFNYAGHGSNAFSSPLHADSMGFGGGGNMGMMGLGGGHDLGMGGPGMGMMGVNHSAGMHAHSGMGGVLPGLGGGAGIPTPPTFHVPGGVPSGPPPGHHGSANAGNMGNPLSKGGVDGGARSASEAAAAASAALASSLGLGAPMTKSGGGLSRGAPGAVNGSNAGPPLSGDNMPPPARAPVMGGVSAASGGGGQQATPGKGMRRDWSLESLERLADVASIESSEIDAMHQMLEQRQGGGAAGAK